jgi:hypothetical protein
MCGSRHHHDPAGRRQDVRASDAERETIISDLRHHAGEGRLTVEELEQRIEDVHAAQTRRDLAALTTDLPRIRRPRDARREFADHLRTYLWVMALLVAIWLVSGMGYFWPIWPAVGWGIAIAMHAPGALRPRRVARP